MNHCSFHFEDDYMLISSFRRKHALDLHLRAHNHSHVTTTDICLMTYATITDAIWLTDTDHSGKMKMSLGVAFPVFLLDLLLPTFQTDRNSWPLVTICNSQITIQPPPPALFSYLELPLPLTTTPSHHNWSGKNATEKTPLWQSCRS